MTQVFSPVSGDVDPQVFDAAAGRLNAWTQPQAAAALEVCCGSPSWVTATLAARPFANGAALLAAVAAAESALSRDDWLAAFAAHPQIGQRPTVPPRWHAAERCDSPHHCRRALHGPSKGRRRPPTRRSPLRSPQCHRTGRRLGLRRHAPR